MQELALTPQARTVLSHLNRTGSITAREALLDHSVQSLTKRIHELREWGAEITTERKRHPVTKQRYARYVLGDRRGA